MTIEHEMMALAMEEARKAAQRGEVPVGAVLVNAQGDILAKAGNAPIAQHDPTAHAEIRAIRAAAQKTGNYRLTDTTLYVTLEPCTMCAGAISLARIKRLVYAAPDVKGGAVHHGAQFFESPTCHHKPMVMAALMAEESANLLRYFFQARRA